MGIRLLLSTIWVVSLATGNELDHLQYVGDMVLRFPTDNATSWGTIKTLILKHIPLYKLDVWKEPTRVTGFADVYIQKRFHYDVIKELKTNQIAYKVLIDDVSRLIKRENYRKRRRKRSNRQTIVGEYVEYSEMIKWLEYMRSLYFRFMSNVTLGQTYENRNIVVYKLGNPGINKPAIWIDAGLHAREWVAPAVAVYLINQLLTKYVWVEEIKELMDKLDWYFLVVANPDGYEYSHNHYRFWRKNTRLVSDSCWGVDLNRNWGYQWGTSSGGDDGQPCGPTYQGPSPESEQETKHVARFLLQHSDVIKAYFSLHSYTQQWFSRWAYTNDVFPDDNDDLMNISKKAVDAMYDVNGKLYKAGNAVELLYSFSGGSPDWARGVAGIKFPFLIELRDTGEYGFLLPAEEIEPTALETWAGVKLVAKEVLRRFVLTATSSTTEDSTSQSSSAKSSTAISSETTSTTSPTSSFSPSKATTTSAKNSSTQPSAFSAVFATAPLETVSQYSDFPLGGVNTQTTAFTPSSDNDENESNSISSFTASQGSSTQNNNSGASIVRVKCSNVILNIFISIYIVVKLYVCPDGA